MKYATSLPMHFEWGCSFQTPERRFEGSSKRRSRFPVGIQYLTHRAWGAGDVLWVLMLFPKTVVFMAVHISY